MRKSENTEAQNGYLKGHILKSTQPRIKIYPKAIVKIYLLKE